MSRAGAIIVKDNTVALIKRTRENKVYYMFPGGQKENNETFEEACVREIKEELGLDIVIGRQIVEVSCDGDLQQYFLCNIVSGIFGTGTGEEYNSGKSDSRGTHEPIWMNINELPSHDVRPACIYEIIINGYIGCPKKFTDLGNGVCIESI